jgi:transposase
VADRLGVNRETLRNWVRHAEVDGGRRPGTSTVDSQRIAELERENRELRRANEILKAASAFSRSNSASCSSASGARSRYRCVAAPNRRQARV